MHKRDSHKHKRYNRRHDGVTTIQSTPARQSWKKADLKSNGMISGAKKEHKMKILKSVIKPPNLRADHGALFEKLLDLKANQWLPIRFNENDKPHNILAPLYSRAKRRNLKLKVRSKKQVYFLCLVQPRDKER